MKLPINMNNSEYNELTRRIRAYEIRERLQDAQESRRNRVVESIQEIVLLPHKTYEIPKRSRVPKTPKPPRFCLQCNEKLERSQKRFCSRGCVSLHRKKRINLDA